MLPCAKAPPVPVEITGQSVGEYILKLNEAYQDCASMLEHVNSWVVESAAEVD
jgi:hypothetical protein